MASEGTGFTWQPSLRGGTTIILVGGDNRGNGSAGSTTNLVSSGVENDISCLSDTSPSSTAGSPAGGAYPTGNGGGFVIFLFPILSCYKLQVYFLVRQEQVLAA